MAWSTPGAFYIFGGLNVVWALRFRLVQGNEGSATRDGASLVHEGWRCSRWHKHEEGNSRADDKRLSLGGLNLAHCLVVRSQRSCPCMGITVSPEGFCHQLFRSSNRLPQLVGQRCHIG